MLHCSLENGRLPDDLEKPGDLPWADVEAGDTGAVALIQHQAFPK
jgi:hypothetical protein